ncbi:MAG: hypothetical protein US89_C0012G0005 [Candidatus Peregrinibacteria bacterium GW2011_GWF2_38_29]|nr:MAG: hypothetical protein US89_C0012G0005 [Candidatus Peregrinibacteria bacterium GW2011_GWF2_38_29]HBB02491.1 hypothetical protein [Candidatus Peregrinibacteria bacterium]
MEGLPVSAEGTPSERELESLRLRAVKRQDGRSTIWKERCLPDDSIPAPKGTEKALLAWFNAVDIADPEECEDPQGYLEGPDGNGAACLIFDFIRDNLTENNGGNGEALDRLDWLIEDVCGGIVLQYKARGEVIDRAKAMEIAGRLDTDLNLLLKSSNILDRAKTLAATRVGGRGRFYETILTYYGRG